MILVFDLIDENPKIHAKLHDWSSFCFMPSPKIHLLWHLASLGNLTHRPHPGQNPLDVATFTCLSQFTKASKKQQTNKKHISIAHAFIPPMANVNTTCSLGMDPLPCRQKSREMCSLPHQGPAMPVCNGIHPSLSKTRRCMK